MKQIRKKFFMMKKFEFKYLTVLQMMALYYDPKIGLSKKSYSLQTAEQCDRWQRQDTSLYDLKND
jgi:hypothetical protein